MKGIIMIHYALSIIFLLSMVPCYTGITTKMLRLGGGILQSEGSIDAENGHIAAGQGYLRNVKVQNDLVLDVKQKLSFSNSSVGNTLTINSGTVELKNINARYLVVRDHAIVYIDSATCVIVKITKDDTATVEHVILAGEVSSSCNA
jgi:hypothetical protein